MNAHKIIAESGIRDPNFLYELAFEILVFVLLFAGVVWLVYAIANKFGSHLKVWQKVVITIVIPIALLIGAGLLTQALGL